MIKKHQEVTGVVDKVLFPNKGVVCVSDDCEKHFVRVKDVIPGQKVRIRISKKKNDRYEGRLIEVEEKSFAETGADPCRHYPECGGCLYQTVPYETQLEWKEKQIREMLSPVIGEDVYSSVFEGIIKSPCERDYRNKMELTFGDCERGGILTLGMHKRGAFYDILPTTECRLMDEDMRKIHRATLALFCEEAIKYYHKRAHEGYLRHLLLRKARTTGEILVSLVTSSQNPFGSDREGDEADLLKRWKERLLELEYDGELAGILHTVNDRLGDVVEDQGTEVLYGRDYFTEIILGLSFEITPFSFFQTNSSGAEQLYSLAGRWLKEDAACEGIECFERLYDLYCGTGTISQVLAASAAEVTGVEIVEEAVCAAKRNAGTNGISNCRFIAGDVLKVLDEMSEPPDCIVLDPPREGINPGALSKITAYGAKRILYISCKASSLARELPFFMEKGYYVKRLALIDMFPYTTGVETCALLVKTSEAQSELRDAVVLSSEARAEPPYEANL